MFYAHLIGLFSVILPEILSLDLVKHGVLLNKGVITPNFSLKFLDYSPTLWFMRVNTIFLLYLR